eukprot:TRINITY_DN9962_c0_g2_i1.p1 TRINITY_DN9962_c0_g2~~TRINITY_DN9962_c0_g2_i1.p1  ORF type:complete len:845 (+),score=224.47 TRINITY_DN9962_c0_g2_i1:199-2733(+)
MSSFNNDSNGSSPTPIESGATGFICPDCDARVEFATEELLLHHWAAFHDDHSKAAEVITEHTGAGPNIIKRSHRFQETAGKARTCYICQQRMWKRAMQCEDCRFACHERCMGQAQMRQDCPGFYQKSSRIVKRIRKIVTGNKIRFETQTVDLDLTYITPKIVAMSLPATGLQATYRNKLTDVANFLTARHGSCYMIINVSDKSYDISEFKNQVLDFGWPDHTAPPLERLCSICNSIDNWLEADPNNVIAVHCKGGKGRTGVVIAAYLSFKRLFPTPEEAMHQFAISRFSDDGTAAVGISNPSQRRYVHYFGQVLTGELKVCRKKLVLKEIFIQGVPNFDGYGGCKPFIIIEEEFKEIFRSREPLTSYKATDMFIHLPLDQELALTGDISIKFYHRKGNSDVMMFRAQFPTCAIDDDVFTLERADLDEGYKDKRVPEDCNVTLRFLKLTAEELAAEEKFLPMEASVQVLLHKRAVMDRTTGFLPPPATPHTMDQPATYVLDADGNPIDADKDKSADNSAQPPRRSSRSEIRNKRKAFQQQRQLTFDASNPFACMLEDDDDEFHDALGNGDQQTSHDYLEIHVQDNANSSPSTASVSVEVDPAASPSDNRASSDGRPSPVPVRSSLTRLAQSARSSSLEALYRSRPSLQRHHSSALLGQAPEQLQAEEDIRLRREQRQRSAADVTMPREHEQWQWYLGPISQTATERLLREKGRDGEFVLRKHPHDAHVYFLSVVHSSEVAHLQLTWLPSQQAFQLKDRALFTDLLQMVKFYSSNTLCRIASRPVKLLQGFGAHGLGGGDAGLQSISRLHLVARHSRAAQAVSMYEAHGNQISDADLDALRRLSAR